jgi:hypothetical protein
MPDITHEEVIRREYDMTTKTKTIWIITNTIKIDDMTFIMAMWLEDHQKECIEGIAEGILTGM